MAKKARNAEVETTDYRHTGQKRTNNPPAKIAAEGKVPRIPKARHYYSPHLPPDLQFDPSGEADKLSALIAKSGKRPLTQSEQKLLAEALRNQQPWLEWAGKREQHERGFFDVDPVALHIHERISTQAILRVLAREDVQRDLFADPQQPYAQAVQFYKHDVDWANRMILGDSLHVMASLARRENLAGRVQMIYMDPPYGIKFGSNFQPQVGQRDVKDRDQDLTREPEMVCAYRDTWTLGIHSYLSYLRDRLIVARDLLAASGSIFVQISDENLHRVRCLLDEVFGVRNFTSLISFKTTQSAGSTTLDTACDYVLWYAKDAENVKYRPLFKQLKRGEKGATRYDFIENLETGEWRRLSQEEQESETAPGGWRLFTDQGLTSRGKGSETTMGKIIFEGEVFYPTVGHWRSRNENVQNRLIPAGRILRAGKTLRFKKCFEDFGCLSLTNLWDDVGGGISSRDDPKIYVVQTSATIIQRCLLMTTDTGDLVLDPTCGSGTTAYVSEQWGRRWITCETSRVALALARQRLMTARFAYYQLRPVTSDDLQRNPGGLWLTDPTGQIAGRSRFECKTVAHITLKSIAHNAALDSIFEKHEPILARRLEDLNAALKQLTSAIRQKLASKLVEKQKREGKKSITEADRRRWELPKAEWHEWEVPFNTDSDWPKPLQDALIGYRAAWRAKVEDVNACIATNAAMEELVDRPEIVNGVVRVTGPFTVEGVRPEELSLGGEGLFGSTANEFEATSSSVKDDSQNLRAYLSQMVEHLRTDGLTFLGNQHRKFARLDPLFEDSSASLIHAEGAWEGTNSEKGSVVAVSFGPQHGPITALQVEEAIRAAKQYDDLVLAGFSFDAEAFAVVHEQNHPKLQIHLANIRPDLNEAMDGLLKDTANSELFAVFGQPEIDVKESKEGWICTLKGVDIYNPLDNTVRSSGADKVAAWFLDSDFDGRCFCITQAFFPDQDAWQKIAKALGSEADLEAFEQLKGTTSLPFAKGRFDRIAVKVIDPRGNEVMAIRKLS
jgi:adenine-specific DNA-methyltransferase